MSIKTQRKEKRDGKESGTDKTQEIGCGDRKKKLNPHGLHRMWGKVSESNQSVCL